jgi:hypothetical protein
MHDHPNQPSRTWYKRATTAWIGFAAAVAALAAVLGNLTTVLDFADRFRTTPPLSLKLSDLRVEGNDPSAIAVTFTITKNIEAAGHNCYATLDSPSTYASRQDGDVTFDLPRNVENDRRTFRFDDPTLIMARDHGLKIVTRLTCDGAVSNELEFPNP